MIATKQASEVRSSGFFPQLLRMSSSGTPSMDPSLDMGFDSSDEDIKKPKKLEEEDSLFVQLEAGIFGNNKRKESNDEAQTKSD
jgi:hypothetical protein